MGRSPVTSQAAVALARGVTVLDGGLATTLESAGHDLSDPLWSARLLLDDPDAIVEAHRAFLTAGAQVISTASYQLAAGSLAASGREPALADALVVRSVELARTAVEEHLDVHGPATPRPLVAASIGPYGALLADGSEYRGDYGRSIQELAAVHRPRVAAAVDAGADLLACETVPSGAEVAAFAEVLRGIGRSAWVTMTLGADGRTTPEGQPLAEALAPVSDLPEVVAVGVNCCAPELVPAALERLAVLRMPIVVYPNLGARWDPNRGTWRRARTTAVEEAPGWVRAGARLVGGCCGTGPDDVAALGALLRSASGTP